YLFSLRLLVDIVYIIHLLSPPRLPLFLLFSFNPPVPTQISTLSLHDALPISRRAPSDPSLTQRIYPFRGFLEPVVEWTSTSPSSTNRWTAITPGSRSPSP